LDTTDPAPAPVASKKGKRYFGLYLLVGGRKPYTIWNPIYCKDSWRDSHYLSLSLYLSPLNVPKTGFPWSIPPDLARLTTSRPVTTIVSFREIWPKPHSFAIARLRLCWPAEGAERIAEVGVNFREIWPKPHSFAIARRRLLRPAEAMQRIAEGVVNVGTGGIDG